MCHGQVPPRPRGHNCAIKVCHAMWALAASCMHACTDGGQYILQQFTLRCLLPQTEARETTSGQEQHGYRAVQGSAAEATS